MGGKCVAIDFGACNIKATYLMGKKINELPSHEIAVERQNELIKIANEKAARGEFYAYTEAWNYVKKCDDELDGAHYNAFVALIRIDTLERLYETIKED